MFVAYKNEHNHLFILHIIQHNLSYIIIIIINCHKFTKVLIKMASCHSIIILMVTIIFAFCFTSNVEGRLRGNTFNNIYQSLSTNSNVDGGTKWAVLIAGSNGYENYRHQVP